MSCLFLRCVFLVLAMALMGTANLHSAPGEPLSGTAFLPDPGDLSSQMVEGINRFLHSQTEESIAHRQRFWNRDFSSREAYDRSIQTNRETFRRIIGAMDELVEPPVSMAELQPMVDATNYTVAAVRWPVFPGVYGEGLWLRPRSNVVAYVVALPDADQIPETLAGLAPGLTPQQQFARRLAENGCEVIVPLLINREDTFSGNSKLSRFTNQPHREWLYRQAFELGRHVIGYEVQKVRAALNLLEQRISQPVTGSSNAVPLPLGVAGYGEGGLIALYTAAIDTRVQSALVSGYFDSRQSLWREPIYRNIFGLLDQFGDAEIATLVTPRRLIVEYSATPEIKGPPAPSSTRSGAAPGRITTPDYQSVELECNRANELLAPGGNTLFPPVQLITGNEGIPTGPGNDRSLTSFLQALGVNLKYVARPGEPLAESPERRKTQDCQQRQVMELENHTQQIFQTTAVARKRFFWDHVNETNLTLYAKATAAFRASFWEENLGRLPTPSIPAKPRSRPIQLPDTDLVAYELVLDVFPEVFAWGILILPRDLEPGERRPVIVCQHGLEGLPADVVSLNTNSPAYAYYKGFGARLAQQGYVVFAPHNPYRGGDRFRQLQRLANPLGKSLFSLIIAQHSRILEWLADQPFVDPSRIGFYGLSYGGKTAMRVPAILERYSLSICSGDFNDWVRKNVSVDFPASYMFTGEYEMPEWDLGHTFNYAEMAALIAPRPFMVERGRSDAVGVDEWVSSEFAPVRELYERLGIPDRCAIEFFDGPHTINGQGTFRFLERLLGRSSSK